MGSDQKIGILITCLEIGGAQKMALQVFDMLDKMGRPVFLITTDQTQGMPLHPDTARADQLEKKLIQLSRIDINQPTYHKILAAPYQYLKLISYIRKNRLDTLLSFEDRANIFNMLSVFTQKRIISIRHPMRSVLVVKDPVKRILIRLFFLIFCKRVSKANFNSRESMDEFKTLFSLPDPRLSVIYNFCDHDSLNRKKDHLSPGKDINPVMWGEFIVACGRFKPVKGFANLVRIFQRVNRKRPGVKLVLLGDGPLRSSLEARIRHLGLQDSVVLPGFQENTAPWIARAAAFVLTSQSEGFPNVLLEAMALKTAVVSVDCVSGPREILSPGSDYQWKTKTIDFAANGVLTPPLKIFDPPFDAPLDFPETCLAEAILALLQDTELRVHYECAGYKRSLDFSTPRQQKKWMDLIRPDAGKDCK